MILDGWRQSQNERPILSDSIVATCDNASGETLEEQVESAAAADEEECTEEDLKLVLAVFDS